MLDQVNVPIVDDTVDNLPVVSSPQPTTPTAATPVVTTPPATTTPAQAPTPATVQQQPQIAPQSLTTAPTAQTQTTVVTVPTVVPKKTIQSVITPVISDKYFPLTYGQSNTTYHTDQITSGRADQLYGISALLFVVGIVILFTTRTRKRTIGGMVDPAGLEPAE